MSDRTDVQRPSLGRVVLAVGHEAGANGTDTAAAVITRVWGQNDDGSWTCNATILPDAIIDASAVRRVTSVRLWEGEVAARASIADYPAATALYQPPRVS